jgi:hypothetical protein
MPDNIRFSSPDTLQKPPGYSHVVEVTGPGRTVYFAGQLGIDKSGKMGANAREQIEIAFENVKAARNPYSFRQLAVWSIIRRSRRNVYAREHKQRAEDCVKQDARAVRSPGHDASPSLQAVCISP